MSASLGRVVGLSVHGGGDADGEAECGHEQGDEVLHRVLLSRFSCTLYFYA